MKRLLVIIVAAALGTSLPAQQSAGPPGWQRVIDGQTPDSAVHFTMMPPGYHVTTGPAATLFNPAHRAEGIFTLESEIFLFPNSSDGEYGLFIGGADLAAEGRAYTAFVARHDGAIAVLRRSGSVVTPVVAWTRHDSVRTRVAEDAVRNVLRVAVERAAVVFSVNGAEVARVPRDSIVTDGLFGFRLGEAMNVHVTTLDFLRRLAPPRER